MSVDVGVLVFWLAVTVVFSAYTKNYQETTLNLGKRISPTDSSTGPQDAIKPKAQTRNNLIMFLLWGLSALQAFVALQWYYAVGALVVSFIGAVPLISLQFIPRPGSQYFVNKITNDCESRLSDYEKAGDEERVAAMKLVLERLREVD